MTDKKKRGRPPGSKGKPKTLSSFKELAESMGELPESELTEMATKAKGPYRPETTYDSVKMKVDVVDEYNPFNNPRFNKKMGLSKDK